MSVSVNIIGKFMFANATEEIGSNFRKRTFKVHQRNKRNPEYPDDYLIELINDKCDLIDEYKHGDIIVCMCNVRGRDWVDKDGDPIVSQKTGKQINTTSLECWNIRTLEYHLSKIGKGSKKEKKEPADPSVDPDHYDLPEEAEQHESPPADEFDDLPF